MQCACAILSSAACPALQYFSALSHKQHDFRKKKIIEFNLCVLLLSTNLSHKFLILRITEWDVIENVYWSSCKLSAVLVWLKKNNFLYRFRKISTNLFSWKYPEIYFREISRNIFSWNYPETYFHENIQKSVFVKISRNLVSWKYIEIYFHKNI